MTGSAAGAGLEGKAARAVFWSGTDVLLRQGMQFLFLVALARMLAPEDFGIVALLSVFTGMANLFIDGGFSAALIQRRSNGALAESSVFFFNIGMGALAALAMCAAAPAIAAYFRHPVLKGISFAMAGTLFIGSFGSIHTALLTRDLGFRTLTKVSVTATALSGAVAVLVARSGMGIWSLVWQSLSMTAVTVVLLWCWHPWRPSASFSVATLRGYFKFGGYLMAIGFLDVLHINLHSFLIGRLYSARDLGFYSRAQTTQEPLSNLVVSVVNRVAFPAFSAVSDEKERLRRGYRLVQGLVMFLNIPAMAALLMLAGPVVEIFFGPRWLPCVPVLRVLSLAGLLWPLHVLNVNLLKAQGRSDLFFRITLIKQSLAVALIVAAAFLGILAIAWAQVIASLACFFVNAYYSGALVGYGARRQLADLVPPLLAALPMVAIIAIFQRMTAFSPQLLLPLALGAGGAGYLAACRIFRVDALKQARSLLKTFGNAAAGASAADGGVS